MAKPRVLLVLFGWLVCSAGSDQIDPFASRDSKKLNDFRRFDDLARSRDSPGLEDLSMPSLKLKSGDDSRPQDPFFRLRSVRRDMSTMSSNGGKQDFNDLVRNEGNEEQSLLGSGVVGGISDIDVGQNGFDGLEMNQIEAVPDVSRNEGSGGFSWLVHLGQMVRETLGLSSANDEDDLLLEDEGFFVEGRQLQNRTGAPTSDEGEGDQDARDRLLGIVGFSLLGLFLALAGMMFYSNRIFYSRRSLNLQRADDSGNPLKTGPNQNPSLADTRQRNNSKMSNFRSSMSSIFSRERLSTWSGRYSGKIDALPGKDEHIANYLRDQRHENNVTHLNRDNPNASMKGSGKLKGKQNQRNRESLYGVPNHKKKRPNKAANALWNDSSLQEMDAGSAERKSKDVEDKESQNTDNESEV